MCFINHTDHDYIFGVGNLGEIPKWSECGGGGFSDNINVLSEQVQYLIFFVLNVQYSFKIMSINIIRDIVLTDFLNEYSVTPEPAVLTNS